MTAEEELVAQTWRGLAKRLSTNAPAAEAMLDELMRAYREPARHYHTLAHIAALLRQLEAHSGAVGNRDAVALAIIFHDVVYDPRRQDNEQQSAVVARARLGALGFPARLIQKVAVYIEATQHGQDVDIHDQDLALLLDLDLSTFASAPEAYRLYARDIRREYEHVPNALYRLGRRQILQGFLARGRIYRTPRLAARWEARARANISEEIARL
jgi:predicted metal-dependent HD superfamily phosphohydrolase